MSIQDRQGNYQKYNSDGSTPVVVVGSLANIPVIDTWSPVVVIDEAVGNTKTFTIPTGKEWEVLNIYASLTTTAIVANRQVWVRLKTSTDVLIGGFQAVLDIPASQTKKLNFGNGLQYDMVTSLTIPMTKIVLPAGYKIVVADVNNVTTLDTLKVYLSTMQRTVA